MDSINTSKGHKPTEPEGASSSQVGQNLPDVIDLTTITEPEGQEFKESLGLSNMLANCCKGYALTFSNGKSPHTSYPFALHDTLVLPWDYSLRNGVMTLFSWTCIGLVKEAGQSCRPCQLLRGNSTLEGILTRMEEGVHESAGYAYYGFSALSEFLRR